MCVETAGRDLGDVEYVEQFIDFDKIAAKLSGKKHTEM